MSAKRDGRTLAPAEVERFVEGYMRGEVSEPAAAAFLMACLLRGMNEEETAALTRALVDSGDTISFARSTSPSVDKHSTGGVGDGVTLIFAPLAAAFGLAVAKLSGRGLGHTGGTLDKLESIPGLRTDLSAREIEAQIASVGCAVAAQSPTLVPADGALYALRDATATVPSIPLIAASVMCKKLAVSSDLILLDVKVGSGAFMKERSGAVELARICLALAARWGRRARAAVTDMSQPLGDAVGNALDVAEAIAILRGERPGRLRDLAVAFAARAAEDLIGLDAEEARQRAGRALSSGEALERFRSMVQAQGGDPRVVDDPEGILPRAPVIVPLTAARSGWVAAIDAERIGRASGALGAGRMRAGDPVDPSVGIVMRPKIGDRLSAGASIGQVHAANEAAAEGASAEVLAAIEVAEEPVEPPPLVYEWLEERGA